MDIYRSYFLERFRAALRSSGLSQKFIAEEVGVDPTAVSNWKRGEDLPSQDRLPKLCKILGVEPDYFNPEGVKNPRPPPGDLKLLIEGVGDDIPIRLLEPLLSGFLRSDAVARATALAAIFDDDEIATPYLRKPSSRANGAKAR